MTDQIWDRSGLEHRSIGVHYLKADEICEHLIGFISLDNLDAKSSVLGPQKFNLQTTQKVFKKSLQGCYKFKIPPRRSLSYAHGLTTPERDVSDRKRYRCSEIYKQISLKIFMSEWASTLKMNFSKRWHRHTSK